MVITIFAVTYPKITYNTGSPENVLSYYEGTQQNQDEGCDGYINSNPPGSPKYKVPIKNIKTNIFFHM